MPQYLNGYQDAPRSSRERFWPPGGLWGEPGVPQSRNGTLFLILPPVLSDKISLGGLQNTFASPNHDMPKTTLKSNSNRIMHLDAVRNPDGSVTVTPENQDRFVIRVSEAIQGCKVAHEGKLAQQRFDFLLQRLGAWIIGREDVATAWITQHDAGFAFFVVRNGVEHDIEFEDALGDLDVELANDPDIGFPLEVISLPSADETSLRSFISDSFTMRFKSLS